VSREPAFEEGVVPRIHPQQRHVETANQGIDLVQSALTFVLGGNYEKV